MRVLMYKCPNTSQDVRTSIDTDPLTLTRLRNLKISVACPHCTGGHNIPANEMYFGQAQWSMPSAQPGLSDYSPPN
jgi:hypothetical protein